MKADLIRLTDDAHQIWEQYQSGAAHCASSGLYEKCERSWRFYLGDQWHSLNDGGETPPSYNILRPIVDYKVATVAQNGMHIVFSPSDYASGYEARVRLCELLNRHASRSWELMKLDKLLWDITNSAAVTGDSFLYFYFEKGRIHCEQLQTENIIFHDEQDNDLQSQEYILLVVREQTSRLKQMARSHGIPEEAVARILPDSDKKTLVSDIARNERSDSEGKCTSLIKLYRRDGIVHYTRSVRDTIIVPETKLHRLKSYPLAHYCWQPQKGGARGIGEVYGRIPNQIEINKALIRLLSGIRQYSFPHIVYDNAVLSREGVEKLGTVGSNIGLTNSRMQSIGDVISYLQPAQINPLAYSIISQMVSYTRELAGAGDASLGNINPENASGAAIIAVRDAQALPLNKQVAGARQFVEDIAKIWFDMWRAYNPSGLSVLVSEEGGQPELAQITAAELEALEVDIRVDISPMNPYSSYAKEDSLQRLFALGAISFEEYVAALPDDSAAPKGRLLDIVRARRAVSDANIGAQ